MRILTRHIYRAFPELDRYSDEQCVRFVRAARGGWMRRTAASLGILLVGAVFLVGGLVGIGYGADRFGGWYDRMTPRVVGVLLAVAFLAVAVSPAPLMGYIARDFLLRRRVRYVLRSRGVCQSCWYSLVGLAVDAANRVTCPECGGVSEVDPSLGELVTSDDGRVRFKPEFEPPDIGSRFWTPARLRTVRRTVFWCVATVVLVGGLSVGGYELFLRRPAAAARAVRTGQKGLEALPGKFGAPTPGDADADVWAILREIEATNATRFNEIRTEFNYPIHINPEFMYVHADAATRQRWRGGDPTAVAQSEAFAREALKRMPESGVLEMMDRLATIQAWHLPKLILDDGSPLVMQTIPEYATAYTMLHATTARAKLAVEQGDTAEIARAIEHAMAMHRLMSESPIPYFHYMAGTTETSILNRVIEAVVPTADAERIDALEAVLERQRVRVAPEFLAEVERFSANEYLAWCFGDPSRVRLGKYSEHFRSFTTPGTPLPGRLGTFSENRHYTNQVFDGLAYRAKLESWERAATPAAAPAPGLFLSAWSGWVTTTTQEARDIALLQRRGIKVMIALERFRIDRGGYPGALSELVPGYLTELPIDPFVGRPFSYKQVDPATDQLGRGYLLYSIGLDGVDDGGSPNPTDRVFPLKPASTALSTTYDYVINEPPAP